MVDPRPIDDGFETLWQRIDGNRRRFGALIVVYTLATTVFFVFCAASLGLLFIFFGGCEVGFRDMPSVGDLLSGLPTLTVFVLGIVILWVIFALSRSEATILARLGATRAGVGEHKRTKTALYDMAIAAGYDRPPPLFVIDSGTVNAFVLGRSARSGAVGVTRGFLARLEPAEQRAVFANLLVRLNARDMEWMTASTVLMHPLWIWKKRYYDVVPFQPSGGAADAQQYWAMSGMAHGRGASPDNPMGVDMQGDSCLLFPPYAIAVVVAHYMFEGQRRAQLHAAEFADAKGMMLLKDPGAMLTTLEKVVAAENRVATAGGQYTQFFYCWSGEESSNDESDPEYRRLVRMRRLLGSLESGIPVEPEPEIPGGPPPAPRLGG
jgi:hypothetical protein